FYFQAEDGIRVFHVTGVQTCALPIFTTTAGQTIGDVVAALNTALGGAATFTLNADGSISTSNSALYGDYSLNVTTDSTQRGATEIGRATGREASTNA